MIASYSVGDSQMGLEREVTSVDDVRELLGEVGAGDGLSATVVLGRGDGATLSFSPVSSGAVFLCWVDAEDQSWSSTGGEPGEDVAFMFFGSYSEVEAHQCVSRDVALRAAERFLADDGRESLGVAWERD